MAAGYEYGNARVRAMKGRLLRRESYEALLAAEGIDGLISALSQSSYGEAVSAALVIHRGFPCVAEALRRNFATEARRIRGFYEGQPQELLDGVLGRWDIFSLKTLLRGKATGVSAEEIMEAVLPAGSLKEAELEKIAQEPSLRASIELIATWRLPFAGVLARELEAYQKTQDLTMLQLALDRQYYEETFESLGGDENAALVRTMLAEEIDAANIMAVLRLVHSGRAQEELAERFGTDRFLSLLIANKETAVFGKLSSLGTSAGLEEVLASLEGTPLGRVLRREATPDLLRLERSLDRFLMERGVGLLRRDPLGIGIPLGYLRAKENEIANLRIIAQGKARGVAVERIRDELYLPLG